MRRTIIAGNWKMFKTVADTVKYFEEFGEKLSVESENTILFVPYVDLTTALEKTEGLNINIGAQNVHFAASGAYTGEISCEMLKAIGVENTLIGHSERRQYFGETDETVNLKIKACQENGIHPYVCCGEPLEVRDADKQFEYIADQLVKGLDGVDPTDLVIAYEPIWAIGTGKTATSEVAQETCKFIRTKLEELFPGNGENVPVLYGGSVKPSNISELLSCDDIDGVLVGGASLTEDFVHIVNR